MYTQSRQIACLYKLQLLELKFNIYLRRQCYNNNYYYGKIDFSNKCFVKNNIFSGFPLFVTYSNY